MRFAFGLLLAAAFALWFIRQTIHQSWTSWSCLLGWREKIQMSNSSAGPSSKSKVGPSQSSESSFKRKRGVFQKDPYDVRFWRRPKSASRTVALVEDILGEYVTDLAHKAQDIGSKRGKLSVEDFLYQIRKDVPKLNRCTELLSMQEELKQARRAYNLDEDKAGTIRMIWEE